MKDIIKRWLGIYKIENEIKDIIPRIKIQKWIADNVSEAVEEIFTDGITNSVYYSPTRYEYLNGRVKMLTTIRVNDAVGETLEYQMQQEEFIDSLVDRINRKQLKTR